MNLTTDLSKWDEINYKTKSNKNNRAQLNLTKTALQQFM